MIQKALDCPLVPVIDSVNKDGNVTMQEARNMTRK